MKEGDINTSFFHKMVLNRRQKLHLHGIKNVQGIWLSSVGEIAGEGVDSFQAQLNGKHTSTDNEFLQHVSSVITADQNESLIEFPSVHEVYNTIHSMDENNVAGPDGYNGFFTEVVGTLSKMIFTWPYVSFFASGTLQKSWTGTRIFPILKVDAQQAFNQFRPISLCNFNNNVISKILQLKLSSYLPTMIFPEQYGFVKGKQIQDNILLAQELIHDIKRRIRGSNVAIKLDKKKAYDSVNWLALIKAMRKIGFCEG